MPASHCRCKRRVTRKFLFQFHEMKLEDARKELPLGQVTLACGIEASACSEA